MIRFAQTTTAIVLIVAIPFFALAQDNQQAPADKAADTNTNNSTLDGEVIYGHKSGMALTYDLIRPKDRGNNAAVVFVVSGGWNSRYVPAEQFRRMGLLKSLSEAGYTLILVRHGSAPRFKVPEAVADVKLALRHIHFNAGNYGFDENRIGICGASAGGHLSLMLGTTADDGKSGTKRSVKDCGNRVACVAAYFPPTDLRTMVGPSDRFPALDFDKDLGDDVSPLVHVTEDDAPTLLVHGTKDRLVPIRHSENIKKKFDEANVACEFLALDGADHGFRGEHAKQAEQAVLGWFEKYLLDEGTQTDQR